MLTDILMGTKLEHAVRNNELSKLLYEEGVYYDWCVTTCFYSAIQYFHVVLIPGNYNGTECKSLEQATAAMNLKDKTKHHVTETLVKVKVPALLQEYRWLKDSSFNARYNDYEVHPQNAKLARKYLKKISEYCDPK